MRDLGICTKLILSRGHHDVKPASICVLTNGGLDLSETLFKFSDIGLSSRGPREPETPTGGNPSGPDYCKTYLPLMTRWVLTLDRRS